MNVKYTVGKPGNRASVEYCGKNDYRVHYNSKQVARKFESLAGSSGFARYLYNQGAAGDPFKILADLVYTDPLLPFADPHVSLQDEMLAALKRAEQFIVNGVALGFIRLPDPDTPDSAHDTLPAIRAAVARAERGHG